MRRDNDVYGTGRGSEPGPEKEETPGQQLRQFSKKALKNPVVIALVVTAAAVGILYGASFVLDAGARAASSYRRFRQALKGNDNLS